MTSQRNHNRPRTRSAAICWLAVAALLPVALLGAQAQNPTRDTTAAAQKTVTGTASITGSVAVDDAQGRPLRRVTIALSSGVLRVPQNTVTDDAGRFVITGLPAGTYTLSATRAGFVPAFYGAKKPGKGPGVPIVIVDGQRLTGIDIKLLHGGVISGVVRAPNGQPASCDVQVLSVQTVNGQKRTQSVLSAALAAGDVTNLNGTATDDRGQYRIYGLPPGDYIVQARVTGATEARPVSAAEVQWAEQATSAGNGGAPASLPPAPPNAQGVTYAPIFFPGVTDSAAATGVTLGPGETREGLDFAMQFVPTAKISGVLLDPAGQPQQGAQISLRSAQADAGDLAALISGLLGGSSSARTGPDGAFTLNGVTPGRYTLSARASAPKPGAAPQTEQAAAMAEVMAMMPGGNGGTLWAAQDVVVDGRDQSGVTLALQEGKSVSGTIVYEGGTPPANRAQTRVMLANLPTGSSPNDVAASMFGGSTLIASAGADGTFSIKGVTPNKYRLSVLTSGMMVNPLAPPVPGAWVLKSAMLNGRDISDVPLEVSANDDVSGIVATFTDHPTELSGTVQDQAGKGLAGYPIIVFSTDRSYWAAGSRRVQQVRPSSDGTFKVVGLPAGEYFMAAVVDLEPNDLSDPAFLENLAANSFKITLADGEKKVQDVKLGG